MLLALQHGMKHSGKLPQEALDTALPVIDFLYV